ncbi:MAG: sugar phosphate isomerase/epimerase family protein [Spirochaetales bacterium]
MIQFGAHAFVWIGDWTTESGNRTIASAAKAGMDFIEIPILDPDSFEAASHRKALESEGLAATCSTVLPRNAHMPETPDKAKAYLLKVLDKVAETGSDYLGGCTGYALGKLTGAPPTESELDNAVSGLAEIADEAADRGITLALEACNRYETYMFNALEDTRNAILKTGKNNLKLHADTYHMNIEEEGFYTPIKNSADVLDYIHMSESHRGLVGSGTVWWDEIWRALSEIKFDGKLALESFAAVNPKLQAATCLWRPTNASPDTLATEGMSFLKDGARRHGLIQDQ